ncbi:hypothetical protein [Pseudomonas sp. Au-Pse12]|uniref:hypothetical protein n=1 Tax=Pseudomonas sp. Au-Pse12 TaxID=2906459 RepID=UPI001E6492CD|nr:hypothetical protein [Pseudomonas sp. Au-Pse12]MCE4057324.1 hypothetical protein [Pseudomonas sp. Au-Pse12]
MFKLEIIRNTPLGKKDDEDSSVSEAIFSTYLEYKTDILLHWDDLTLCLSRRGDISEIYDDIIDMLNQLEYKTKSFFMAFLSSTFTTHWDFKVIDTDLMMVSAKWVDVVYFDKKKTNIKNSSMLISISDFTEQWKKILRTIKKDLLFLGYDNTLDGFIFLDNLQ